MEYFNQMKIGRLFFKYIFNTKLEKLGWTAEKLAEVLERHGFIKFTQFPQVDRFGDVVSYEKRYVEQPGKTIKRSKLVELILSGELA